MTTKPTATHCRWCHKPITPERRRAVTRTRYCSDECQMEDAYEDAEAEAIAEVQQRGPKVLGMVAAHPAAPRDVRLVGVEGSAAVLRCRDGRQLKRPLAEVYDPSLVRSRASVLFIERTATWE